jgi:hypothetical protein
MYRMLTACGVLLSLSTAAQAQPIVIYRTPTSWYDKFLPPIAELKLIDGQNNLVSVLSNLRIGFLKEYVSRQSVTARFIVDFDSLNRTVRDPGSAPSEPVIVDFYDKDDRPLPNLTISFDSARDHCGGPVSERRDGPIPFAIDFIEAIDHFKVRPVTIAPRQRACP